jgi:hypothetical protein
MSLLSYGEEQLPQKYSYPYGLSRGKPPLEIAPVIKPKLMICVYNVVFSGKTPKTTFQEEVDAGSDSFCQNMYRFTSSYKFCLSAIFKVTRQLDSIGNSFLDTDVHRKLLSA